MGSGGGVETVTLRRIASVEAQVSECAVRLGEVREDHLNRLVLVDGILGVDLARRGWMRIDATNRRFECRPQLPDAGGVDAAKSQESVRGAR